MGGGHGGAGICVIAAVTQRREDIHAGGAHFRLLFAFIKGGAATAKGRHQIKPIRGANGDRLGCVTGRANRAVAGPRVAGGKDWGNVHSAQGGNGRAQHLVGRVGGPPRVVDHIGRFAAICRSWVAGEIGGAEQPLKGFETANVILNAAGHGAGTDAGQGNPFSARRHANLCAAATAVTHRSAHGVGAMTMTVKGLARAIGSQGAIGIELAVWFKPVVVVIDTTILEIAAILFEEGWVAEGNACIKTGDHRPCPAHPQFRPDPVSAD